jgi:hypothetical protein
VIESAIAPALPDQRRKAIDANALGGHTLAEAVVDFHRSVSCRLIAAIRVVPVSIDSVNHYFPRR